MTTACVHGKKRGAPVRDDRGSVSCRREGATAVSERPARRLLLAACLLVAASAGASAADDLPALFREARLAEQRRDFRAALEKYNAVLVADPKIAEVWANKGLVLYELERHREALQAFDKAAELKPTLFVPQLFRGLELLRFGEPRKALSPLNAAIRLDSGNLQARCALADAHARIGDYERSIRLYREILDRQAGSEPARYGLAIAYLDYSKATARKLVESGSPYGKLLLAEYLAVGGASEAAEANYLAAFESLPASPEVRSAVRAFYTGAGRPEKAKSIPAPDPASGDPLESAIVLASTGRFEQALAALSQAQGDRALYWVSVTCRFLARDLLAETVTARANSFEARLLLADLAKNMGDDATAQAEYGKAAALAPGNAEVQLLFIRFAGPRDPAAALDAARRAIARLPNHPELNVEFGKLLLEQGMPRDAAMRFRRALDAEPGLAAAHAGLADAYAAAGEIKSAITEMERAARSDPDGSWHYRLANWYREAGRAENARAAFAETARIKSELLARQQARFFELNSPNRADRSPTVAAR